MFWVCRRCVHQHHDTPGKRPSPFFSFPQGPRVLKTPGAAGAGAASGGEGPGSPQLASPPVATASRTRSRQRGTPRRHRTPEDSAYPSLPNFIRRPLQKHPLILLKSQYSSVIGNAVETVSLKARNPALAVLRMTVLSLGISSPPQPVSPQKRPQKGLDYPCPEANLGENQTRSKSKSPSFAEPKNQILINSINRSW